MGPVVESTSDSNLSVSIELREAVSIFISNNSVTLNQILSTKITLSKTTPTIWRRGQVRASITFFDLQHVIHIRVVWTKLTSI